MDWAPSTVVHAQAAPTCALAGCSNPPSGNSLYCSLDCLDTGEYQCSQFQGAVHLKHACANPWCANPWCGAEASYQSAKNSDRTSCFVEAVGRSATASNGSVNHSPPLAQSMVDSCSAAAQPGENLAGTQEKTCCVDGSAWVPKAGPSNVGDASSTRAQETVVSELAPIGHEHGSACLPQFFSTPRCRPTIGSPLVCPSFAAHHVADPPLVPSSPCVSTMLERAPLKGTCSYEDFQDICMYVFCLYAP